MRLQNTDLEQAQGEALARQALARFALPEYVSFNALKRRIELMTGMAVVINTMPNLAGYGVTGAWAPRNGLHNVLLAATPSRLHRRQIALHEFGHILLAHFELVSDLERLESCFPNAPRVKIPLGRTRRTFDTATEIAAEAIATCLAAEIRLGGHGGTQFDSIFA